VTVSAVTTPASRKSLTTVERYRDAMPETDALNAQLETLIGQASSAIEAWTDRRFARERVTETFYETEGTRIFLLERRPALQIHTVTIDGQPVDTGSWILERPGAGQVGIYANGPNWLWDQLVGYSGGTTYGISQRSGASFRVEIDYTGGYIVPGQIFDGEDEPDLPPEIEAACQLSVRTYLETIERRVGVTAERLGDASWSYGTGTAATGRKYVTDDVALLLTNYRTVIV
jgi:hypothetical protein